MNIVDLPIALGAGFLSVLSPCCLPLIPGYIGYMTGMSATEAAERRVRPLLAALLFVAGFTVIFTLLGASASVVGVFLLRNRSVAQVIGGAVILGMGAVILLESRISWLARSGGWAFTMGRGQLWAAPLLGAAFAASWTPCIGPVLGGILTLAASVGHVGEGMALLTVYSLGLGIPFIALSLSAPRVRDWLRRVGRRAMAARMISGGVLVAMGVLLITGTWLTVMSPLLSLYSHAQWPSA